MTYTVQAVEHQFFGGYSATEWTLVDEDGNYYRRDGVTLRFLTREAGEKYAAMLNGIAADLKELQKEQIKSWVPVANDGTWRIASREDA